MRIADGKKGRIVILGSITFGDRVILNLPDFRESGSYGGTLKNVSLPFSSPVIPGTCDLGPVNLVHGAALYSTECKYI